MNRRFHGVLLFAAMLGSPHLSAAQPVWKEGPGRMNLGGKAVLPVPKGYLYHEGPLAPVRLDPANPTSVKEAQLGAVRRGLSSIVFSYVADPNPAATRWLMRAQAFLNLHLGANLAANASAQALSALTAPGFRRPGTAVEHPISAKIIENDWFDPATASLHCAVEIAPPGKPASVLSIRIRKRVTLFFGRHGTLAAESSEILGLGLMGRDDGALLQNFSFAPEEAPPRCDRIPLMVSGNIRRLPRYAFGGLFAGLALALLRNLLLLHGGHVAAATGPNV
jgi:hypothetical protein